MHQTSTEQYRIVAAVVAAAARLPKSRRRADHKRFLEAYYANVDAEDMAARDPAALAGAALAHLEFAHRRRGRALVRVFNPTVREHGYTSPHTVIEMVNDDMPFLVDTIGLALTRRSLTMHFLAHPIFAVARDGAGVLRSIEERAAAGERRQRLESFQHVEIDRTVDPAALQSLCSEIEHSMRDVRVACADWAKMRAAARADLRRSQFLERALRSARRERGAGAALLDGGPALHLSRLSRSTACAAAEDRTRSTRWRRPASGSCGRPQTPAEHQPHPGERYPPTEPLARPGARHQGELAILGPSRRLSRLRRRQALRRRGPADRRAALSGAVDLVGLQLDAARDSAGAPQGDPGSAALRARSRQPRRQGAAAHPGIVPAGRAVPGERAGSDPPGDRHLRSAGAAARAAAVAPRPVSTLLFVPDFRAAREVQHPGAPAHRARHRRSDVRDRHGISGADRRVETRPHSHRRAHPAERRRAHRQRCARAQRGARRALLVGRLQDGAARAFRRSLRAAPVRDLRPGVPRRLHRGFQRRRGGARRRLSGGGARRSPRACTWTSTGPIRGAKTSSF